MHSTDKSAKGSGVMPGECKEVVGCLANDGLRLW